jgi:hypothetical protein
MSKQFKVANQGLYAAWKGASRVESEPRRKKDEEQTVTTAAHPATPAAPTQPQSSPAPAACVRW